MSQFIVRVLFLNIYFSINIIRDLDDRIQIPIQYYISEKSIFFIYIDDPYYISGKSIFFLYFGDSYSFVTRENQLN